MEDIAQMVDKLQLKIEEQRETIEPLLNRVRLVKTLLLQFFSIAFVLVNASLVTVPEN